MDLNFDFGRRSIDFGSFLPLFVFFLIWTGHAAGEDKFIRRDWNHLKIVEILKKTLLNLWNIKWAFMMNPFMGSKYSTAERGSLYTVKLFLANICWGRCNWWTYWNIALNRKTNYFCWKDYIGWESVYLLTLVLILVGQKVPPLYVAILVHTP